MLQKGCFGVLKGLISRSPVTFPAEFGNATAGVFDMRLRNGNSQKHEYAFQIGVQGIEAAAEGPFNNRNGSSFLINYRYSTMALIFPLLPELKGSNELPNQSLRHRD